MDDDKNVNQEQEDKLESQEQEAPQATSEQEVNTSDEHLQEQEEQSAEAEQQPEVESSEKPKRPENLRLQQVLSKLQTQNESPSEGGQQSGLNYRDFINADDEIYQKLEEDRQNSTKSAYDEGIARAEAIEWKTNLRIDAPNVERKYPILDKNSSEFYPAVADTLNTLYLQSSGYDSKTGTVKNPSVSYSDFVESHVELATVIAESLTRQNTENITKQAAQTGIRPDGSSTKMNLDKAPEDMTNEELNAKIAQLMPKR